jgi:ABC-type glycerol-3-phosphate transport system substrate-binding protein
MLLPLRIVVPAFMFLAEIMSANAVEPAANPAPDNSVTIQVGTLTAPDGSESWFQSEIEAFVRSHPGTHVDTVAMSDPQRFETPIEELPGLARNVIGIDSRSGYETELLVEQDLLVPIDDFLPDSAFSKNDFFENYWDAVTYKGKIWGVPWAVEFYFLAYNASVFRNEGVSTGPPQTWDAFKTLSLQLTKDTDADGKPDRIGQHTPTQDSTLGFIIASYYHQIGGTTFVDGRIVLEAGAISQAFEFGNLLYTCWGNSNHDRRTPGEIFSSSPKMYAMYILPSKMLPLLLQNPDFLPAALPRVEPGAKAGVAPRRLYFAIRRSTPNEEKASWEFVKWMSRPDVAIPNNWTGYPCRKDIFKRQTTNNQAKNNAARLSEVLAATAFEDDYEHPIGSRFAALNKAYGALAPLLENYRDSTTLVQRAQDLGNSTIASIPHPHTKRFELYLGSRADNTDTTPASHAGLPHD